MLDNKLLQLINETPCISVDETVIEKWVGLTRRITAIARAYHPDDETLIRISMQFSLQVKLIPIFLL